MNWKLYIRLFLSLSLIAKPVSMSLGCAGYEDPNREEFFYSLLDPAKLDILDKIPSPFDHTFDAQEINIQSWIDYFGGIPSMDEIRTLIFNSDYEHLQQQLIHSQGKETENKLISLLQKRKEKETRDYLLFAKRTEPHATWYPYYWDAERDTVELGKFIEEAKANYSNTKSSFIKKRYAYQIIRLNHYRKRYEEVITAFDTYLQPYWEEDFIDYWALSNKAGALQHLGKHPQSIHHFAQVYLNCPSRRNEVLLSIRWQDENAFREALQLCQSDEEEIAIWFMLASLPNSHGLEAMRAIAAIDSQSPALETLLSYELELAEDLLLPPRFSWINSYESVEKEDWGLREQLVSGSKESYVKDLSELVSILADDESHFTDKKKTLNPPKWELAAAYLNFLIGDTEGMTYFLKRVKRRTEHLPLLKEQVLAIEMAHQYNTLSGPVETELETNFLADLASCDSLESNRIRENLREFIILKMGLLFYRSGETRNAELCQWALSPPWFSIETEAINQLDLYREYHWLNEVPKTPFQERFLQYYPMTLGDFHEVFGTLSLNEFQFLDARESFQQVENSNLKMFAYTYGAEANPFESRISDCNDCDLSDPDFPYLSKLDIVNQAIAHDSILHGEFSPEAKAQAALALGNFFYHLSHVGNAHTLTGSYKNIYQYDSFYPWQSEGVFEYKHSDTHEEPKLDAYSLPDSFKALAMRSEQSEAFEPPSAIELAKLYYVEAYRNASATELKARCLFLAAKCEQVEYFEEAGTHNPDLLIEYRKFFTLLHRRYNDTEFYREAIEECKYFRWFSETE